MLKTFRSPRGGVLVEFGGVETDPILSWRRAHEFAGLEAPQPTLVGFSGGPALAEGFHALAARVGDVTSARLFEDEAHDFEGYLARGIVVGISCFHFLLMVAGCFPRLPFGRGFSPFSKFCWHSSA